MPLFGLKKYQNAKCKNANIFGAVKNARSERRENVTQGSNLTAEKWSVLVGIVQTNTGHFVYGEIFVILCVKRKRQERYKTNYQRITKKKKEDKNMQVTATVKIMGEEASGISAQTGNPWKSRMILLEWNDTEGTNRIWCALFNAKLEAFCQSGIGVGDTVLVSVRFTARTYRTGFFRTEAEIMTICKA